ncbi:ATP-dependent Clp protease ATP-binding subunit ClpX [Lachnospiraceae bacterium]|nr:ATP-dependent Clp protease ATP-binding subunit ClpX [Lachnospiraceae bacterium]
MSDNKDEKNTKTEVEICTVCRRPDTVAGKMLHFPNNMNICNDCMQRFMDQIGSLDLGTLSQLSGMPMDYSSFMAGLDQAAAQGAVEKAESEDVTIEKKEDGEPVEAKDKKEPDTENPEKKETSGKKSGGFGIPGFPNIQFLNLGDFGGPMQGQTGKVHKSSKEDIEKEFDFHKIPKPHALKKMLDEYVIGQDHAKKVVSVAVYNHFKRINAEVSGKNKSEIDKSNILLLGPTGCGKTYLVQTLAKLLQVPLAIADATSLTEAGYIGDDIESVVSKLLAAADNDVERAERGIIFIDEIDKIAKKKNSTSRDVSGESVQQGMLKLLEGAEVEVPVGANSKNAMVPMVKVNTRNILFICGGAFPDLDELIRARLRKETSIGFNAELKDHWDKEKDILKKVTTEDLRSFGMIPEFLGRLPITCPMEGLTEDSMVRILREPKNAIIRQYEDLLEMDEVQLRFTDDALHAIAAKAMKRDTGARALRSIIEAFMLDIMFEVPKDDNIGRVTITKEFVEGSGGPVIDLRGVAELEAEQVSKIEEKKEDAVNE